MKIIGIKVGMCISGINAMCFRKYSVLLVLFGFGCATSENSWRKNQNHEAKSTSEYNQSLPTNTREFENYKYADKQEFLGKRGDYYMRTRNLPEPEARRLATEDWNYGLDKR